jgi:hypothetical protein
VRQLRERLRLTDECSSDAPDASGASATDAPQADQSSERYDAVLVRAGGVASSVANADAVAMRAGHGGFVAPGFHDAHVHPPIAAAQANDVVVSGSSTAKIVAAVSAYATANPARPWITGHGWALAGFGTAPPTRADLDGVPTKRSIALRDSTLHNVWASSAAIAAAKITAATMDPLGGRIVRDARGEPTGLFLDEAAELVFHAEPAPTDAEIRKSLLVEQKKSLEAGYTAVHGGPVSAHYAAAYAALDGAGDLAQRVFCGRRSTSPTRGSINGSPGLESCLPRGTCTSWRSRAFSTARSPRAPARSSRRTPMGRETEDPSRSRTPSSRGSSCARTARAFRSRSTPSGTGP